MGCCLLRTSTALALCVANVHATGLSGTESAAVRALDDKVPNWWQGAAAAAAADGQGQSSTDDQVPLWWQQASPTKVATTTAAPTTEPPTTAPTAEEGWKGANVNSVPVVVRPPAEAPVRPLPAGTSEVQIVCFFGLVEPCGQVVVPSSGFELQTPFGPLQIKGSESCGLEEEAPINSNYALMICLALLTLSALGVLCLPGHRQDLHRFRNVVVRGKANDHSAYDHVDTGADQDCEDQELTSHRALVASGIYQALAVLHPGVLGYHWWSKCCTKAIACCAVQMYLAASLLHQVLSEWEFHNLKPPIWFLTNGWNMLAAFVGFGTLCNLFAMRSTENLLTSLEATAFIVGRRHLGMMPEDDVIKAEDISGLLLVLLEPSIQAAARVNGLFWSFLSVLTDLSLALVLQAVFLLHFATYRGSAERMILVAVVLYFVLDADRRILDADPRLRRAYEKHILSLESLMDAPAGPSCLVRLGAVFALILRCVVPAGLLLAALTAWHERASGRVWGGSPLCDSGL